MYYAWCFFMDASMYQDKEAKVGSYSFGDALLIDTGPEAALSAPSWVARVTSVCLKCHFAGYRGVGDTLAGYRGVGLQHG